MVSEEDVWAGSDGTCGSPLLDRAASEGCTALSSELRVESGSVAECGSRSGAGSDAGAGTWEDGICLPPLRT